MYISFSTVQALYIIILSSTGITFNSKLYNHFKLYIIVDFIMNSKSIVHSIATLALQIYFWFRNLKKTKSNNFNVALLVNMINSKTN